MNSPDSSCCAIVALLWNQRPLPHQRPCFRAAGNSLRSVSPCLTTSYSTENQNHWATNCWAEYWAEQLDLNFRVLYFLALKFLVHPKHSPAGLLPQPRPSLPLVAEAAEQRDAPEVAWRQVQTWEANHWPCWAELECPLQ